MSQTQLVTRGITRGERLRSAPMLVVVLALGVLCLTPLSFMARPIGIREYFYTALVRSRTLAATSPAAPGSVSPAVKVWNWFHAPSLIIALLSIPAGISIWLWFGLGLSEVWSRAGVQNQLDVAQLLASTIVGGIAIDVFLSNQLHGYSPPRIACSFLLSEPASSGHGTESFNEIYLGSHEHVGAPRWFHLRITNVGPVYYSGFSVSLVLPEGWSEIAKPRFITTIAAPVRFEGTHEGEPTFVRTLEDGPPGSRTVDFDPISSPRETGPGATIIYSVYLEPPQRATAGRLTLRASANESGEFAVRRLDLIPGEVARSTVGTATLAGAVGLSVRD